MLLVDRGFPIDVIFDTSVWGGREKKERKQGEQANCGFGRLVSCQLPPVTQIQHLWEGSETPKRLPLGPTPQTKPHPAQKLPLP